MLDIFNADPFKIVRLTDAVNKLKFVPGRLAEMGLFKASGTTALTVAIEEKDGQLILIPPTPRGSPGTTMDKSKRTMRQIGIPHHQIDDTIMADEVQGVREFGTEDQLQTVMGKVLDRAGEISQSFAATEEYSRIGAVKGVITYSDGTTLDLFSTFGVSQDAEIDFDLDNASPASGALRKKCATTVRLLAGNLGGVPFSRVRALCGDAFFDDLLAHTEVRATFTGWSEAQILREGYIEPNGKSYGAFEFGGIIWENYRGAVGATTFVNTDKCHIFVEDAPGLFRTVYAPADYIETVNTMGVRMYSKVVPMPNGKGVTLENQTNPIHYCTRPKTLLLGKRT